MLRQGRASRGACGRRAAQREDPDGDAAKNGGDKSNSHVEAVPGITSTKEQFSRAGYARGSMQTPSGQSAAAASVLL